MPASYKAWAVDVVEVAKCIHNACIHIQEWQKTLAILCFIVRNMSWLARCLLLCPPGGETIPQDLSLRTARAYVLDVESEITFAQIHYY